MNIYGTKRYNDLNGYFRKIFGCRVQKISIDAGLSCPNRDGTISTGGCIYCNAKGSGTGAHSRGLSITEQLDKGKQALAKRYKAKKFIAYFQSFTNTYAPVAKLEQLYGEALGVKDVVGLAIGTRPDCVDEQVLELLQNYARNWLIWIEYGLQTVHDATLSFINRGHDFKAFQNAVDATINRNIKICAHIILGLPGETGAMMMETARILSDMRIDGIKLHLLYVVKGTKLAELYNKGIYRCLEQDEYVNIIADFLEKIPSNIVIQRLTGDPHPEELIAPSWSIKKTETLALINEMLTKRDSWQGKTAERKEK
ncbi:MAG: TIGR01212 family radical SAM protein [Deltaproteobacteria bacterium]|nr:TIGR01212 family radical SAM protein [Deltaproteobacteria bacterium]